MIASNIALRAWASVLICLACHRMQAAEPQATTRVAIVIGPSSHPPGTHEVAAGGRLLKHCIEHMSDLPGFKADLFLGWPVDDSSLDSAGTIVFNGDTFPPQRMPETKSRLAKLDSLMKRGCGIVCVHYGTGLRNEDVAKDGEHPLLHWMGGYFATKCEHHQSVARIYPAATIAPATPRHPICRGWKDFTVHDEPYIHNYFGKDDDNLAPNVTAIATSMLPPEKPSKETVAWCIERPDGGRGFGIVMPHFYKNWADENLRRCILNGVVWTAKREVPAGGVFTATPDLASFAPDAVEPPVKAPTKPAQPAEPKQNR